jgi:diacylglycerol kinase (ATP)
MSERVAIFANPIAGRGRGRLLAERLRGRFAREGWEVRVVFERPDLAQQDAIAGITAAVSIGGDGTLRSVVERVTDAGANEGPGVLVVPMGTANLMGKHLGMTLKDRGLEERAVAAILLRQVVRLDVGRIKSQKREATGQPHELHRLFLLMVGIGIDGEVVHAMDRARKGPIAISSYLKPGLGAFAEYHYHKLEVEVDGQRVFERGPAVAFVGNVKEYGTGFEILSLAKSDDELLDICVLPANRPKDLINHFLAAAAGEHIHGEGVVYVKGRRVKITSPEPVAVQADGDPAGWTPVEMGLLPTRVAFIVP